MSEKKYICHVCKGKGYVLQKGELIFATIVFFGMNWMLGTEPWREECPCCDGKKFIKARKA